MTALDTPAWTVGTCAVGGPPAVASDVALSWSVQQHQLTPGMWEPADAPVANRFVTAEIAFANLWARRKDAHRTRLNGCLGLEFDTYTHASVPDPDLQGCRTRIAYADSPDDLPPWCHLTDSEEER